MKVPRVTRSAGDGGSSGAPDGRRVLPSPSRTVVRRALLVAGVLCIALLLGAAAYGWYVSGRIAAGALEVPQGPRPLRLEVVGSTASDVTLRDHGDPGWGKSGRWGLEWRAGDASGYAQIGAVLGVDAKTGDVRRALLPGWPPPPAGAVARLDNFAFPGDPSSVGVAFHDVLYDAPGGPTPAWMVPGARSTWLIYVHGKGATRAEALRLLPTTAGLGFPALVIAYRNDPEAPGASGRYGYGEGEWADVEGAARYALDHGALDLVLVGYSMGGGIVLSFMEHSSLASSVDALILDAPMLDLRAIARDRLARAGVPGFYAWWPLWLTSRRYGIDWSRIDYLAAAARLTVPVLLFHGTADDVVPVALSDALAAARPDLVEYHRVPGAHHVGSWNLDPAAYERAAADFLDRVVAPSGTATRVPAEPHRHPSSRPSPRAARHRGVRPRYAALVNR